MTELTAPKSGQPASHHPMPAKAGKVFTNRKFYDHDFSNQDLSHADFRSATLVNCKFDSANLEYADFTSANCYQSSFLQARLYHTNFKDAVLAYTKMDPRDMFCMTLTVSCDTFDNMKIGKIWLASWLYLPILADLPDDLKNEIRGVLVKLIGEERLKSLERHFADRQL